MRYFKYINVDNQSRLSEVYVTDDKLMYGSYPTVNSKTHELSEFDRGTLLSEEYDELTEQEAFLEML